MATYAYVHHPGYGRDDHMAGELIARAIRQLGGDTDDVIASHAGFASHAVPAPGVAVYLDGYRNKRRMMSAMRRAKREHGVRGCHDCCIAVEAVTLVRSGESFHWETSNGRRA